MAAPLGSAALSPSSSPFFFSQPKQQAFWVQARNHIIRGKESKLKASSSTAETTSFGFKSLTETFWVDVQRAEERPLKLKLSTEPLSTVGSNGVEKLENVAIRVELSNGCVGWGEAAVLPEKLLPTALAKANEACEFLRRIPPTTLSSVLQDLAAMLPGHEFASVRAGVEMALIDAVANSIDVPLWRLFGGVSNSLTTAVTIPITSPAEASELASNYCRKGFNTIKINMGLDLNAELEVIKAVQVAQPNCLIILDANEKYTSEEAILVLEKLHEMGVTPVLFEQPVHRDDWSGLSDVCGVARGKYGLHVAADESCQTLVDVQKVVQDSIVDVINIKLAKFGVLGALQVIEIARKSSFNLVIDSTVETRLATGFAGHLACGLGCFKYVSLDSPFMLSEDPVFGGYEVSGSVYKFTNARGQGGFLKQDSTVTQ